LSERLEAEHDGEIQLIRQECQWAIERRSIELQIALTELADTQENRRRRENLQWELERAEAAQRQREIDWEFERRKRAQQWDEEHRRRQETLRLRRTEQDVDRENLAGKLELLKQAEDLGTQRRQQQLEQLLQLSRARAESEKDAADAAAKRERERIEILKSLDPKALVALAGGDGAAQLAELLKHEATETSRQIESRAQSGVRDEAHAELRRLLELHQEQLRRDAENRAADAREALASQRGLAETAFAALGQAAAGRTAEGGSTHVAAPAGSARRIVCPVCRCENAPELRYCGNCGNQL
jgi:hypothetical protein